jgi:hypothetical protein
MAISKAGVGALGLVWAVGVMPGCGSEDSPGGRESGGSGLTTGGSGASAGAGGAGAGGTGNAAGASAAGGVSNTGGASGGTATGGSGNSGGSSGASGDAGSAGDAGESGAGGAASGEGGEGGEGGDQTSGGTSNGGTSNGGTSNGGTSNGGTSNGGTSNGGTSNGGTSNGGLIDDGTLGLPETIPDGPCGVCPIGLTCGGGGDAEVCGTVEALPNGKVCSVDGFCFKYPLPQNNTLHDASARGDVIWAVGDRGTVLRYDGESWSGLTNLVYRENTPQDFLSVWVAPSGEVWIGGDGGFLLRGLGSNWNQLKIPSTVLAANDHIHALAGSSASDVWLGTQSGRLVHFDGENFTLETTYPGALTDIEVVAANDIYVSGAHGVDHYDGEEWSPENASFSTVYAVAARTATDVWAVGASGNIYRKLAGTWQSHDRSGTAGYQAVIPLGANDVWVVGREFVHFDGLAWTVSSAPDVFLAAAGTPAGSAVAVGQNGATVHFTSGAPVVVNDGEKQYWDYATLMHGYSNTDFWIAGQDRSDDLSDDYSLLLHYDGSSFTRITASSSSWNALWVEQGGGVHLAPAAGSSARYYLPAGSLSVQSQPAGATRTRRAYFGTADDALWSGGRGLMEYWNGEVWSVVAHPFAGSSTMYTGMWGSAADEIWAVTDTATAAYYDGETWEAVALPGVASGISGRSRSEVYAADGDCVYEYDGANWEELHCFQRQRNTVASVATCNDSDVWVAGYGSSLIHYRGAHGWRDIRTGTDGITDVYCVSGDKVWASGSGQSVLLLER